MLAGKHFCQESRHSLYKSGRIVKPVARIEQPVFYSPWFMKPWSRNTSSNTRLKCRLSFLV